MHHLHSLTSIQHHVISPFKFVRKLGISSLHSAFSSITFYSCPEDCTPQCTPHSLATAQQQTVISLSAFRKPCYFIIIFTSTSITLTRKRNLRKARQSEWESVRERERERKRGGEREGVEAKSVNLCWEELHTGLYEAINFLTSLHGFQTSTICFNEAGMTKVAAGWLRRRDPAWPSLPACIHRHSG